MTSIAIRNFTKQEFEDIKNELKSGLKGFSYRQNHHNGIGVNPTKRIGYKVTLEQADFILGVLKSHNCFTDHIEEHINVFRSHGNPLVHSQTFSMIHKLA